MRNTLLFGLSLHRIYSLVLTLLIVSPVHLVAQEVEIASIKNWTCGFSISVAVDWESDFPENPTTMTESQMISIDNVDVDKGTAQLIGNTGADPINISVVAPTKMAVNFLEVTPGGLMNLTTIFPASIDVQGQRAFKAVQSRHLLIAGDPLPIQLYGFCIPRD